MKIAVYAICKNEAKHFPAWLKSTRDADVRLVADTGSTDGSEKMADHHISILPFRFDIARNTALALVPADVDWCISLDMDETLEPGWRESIERVAAQAPEANLIWVNYKTPGMEPFLHNSRVHKRHGFYWDHPCHECIMPWMVEEKPVVSDSLTIHHTPDLAKPRSQYLPMLTHGLHERPTDRRRMFYYGRELFVVGDYVNAHRWLSKYLELWRASGEDMWGEVRQAAALIVTCEGVVKELAEKGAQAVPYMTPDTAIP